MHFCFRNTAFVFYHQHGVSEQMQIFQVDSESLFKNLLSWRKPKPLSRDSHCFVYLLIFQPQFEPVTVLFIAMAGKKVFNNAFRNFVSLDLAFPYIIIFSIEGGYIQNGCGQKSQTKGLWLCFWLVLSRLQMKFGINKFCEKPGEM